MHSMGTSTRGKIIEALHPAGAEGLRAGALLRQIITPQAGKRPAKEAKAALENEMGQTLASLTASGEIVNFGTAKTPCYVLAEFDRRTDWACATLEGKETPGRATLYNSAALRKGHRKGVTRGIVEQAIERLVLAGRLIEVRPGKTVYYLHASSILPLIRPDRRLAAADSREPAPFSPATIRAAYNNLVRETGFADVPIADLYERVDTSMEALQAWLREESRAGRAVPTRGDWSLAGDAVRAAALQLRGEPHLQIRLL